MRGVRVLRPRTEIYISMIFASPDSIITMLLFTNGFPLKACGNDKRDRIGDIPNIRDILPCSMNFGGIEFRSVILAVKRGRMTAH